jgi:ketosteroid isomerase-like protein
MKEATMGAATEGQTEKARRALEQVCARGDFQAAQDLYRGEFLDHVNGMDFHGQVGIRKSVGLYLAIFPDLRIDVEDQVSEGDRVVSRWTLYGTHRGREVRLSGITISRFHDGKIAEDWSTSDTLDLLRQLGLRRSLVLGLRYARGRLSHGEKT